MYTYIHVCMYVYIYIYIYIHTQVSVVNIPTNVQPTGCRFKGAHWADCTEHQQPQVLTRSIALHIATQDTGADVCLIDDRGTSVTGYVSSPQV